MISGLWLPDPIASDPIVSASSPSEMPPIDMRPVETLAPANEAPRAVERWSCANVLGIEQLESTTHYCLFCKLINVGLAANSYFVDSFSFGRHLIDEHHFGDCDLDDTFDSASAFAEHLQYHYRQGMWASGGILRVASCLRNGSRVFVSFRCPRKGRRPSAFGDSLPLRPKMIEESAATANLVRSQLRNLLQSDGFWPTRPDSGAPAKTRKGAHDCPSEDSEVSDILAALQSLKSSANTASAKTRYRVACLMEEAAILELDPRLSWQGGGFADHARISEHSRNIFGDICGADNDEPRQYIYSHDFVRPTTDQGCLNCKLSAEMRVAFACAQDIQLHLESDHGIVRSSSLEEITRTRVQAIPLQLSPHRFPRIGPKRRPWSMPDSKFRILFSFRHNGTLG